MTMHPSYTSRSPSTHLTTNNTLERRDSLPTIDEICKRTYAAGPSIPSLQGFMKRDTGLQSSCSSSSPPISNTSFNVFHCNKAEDSKTQVDEYNIISNEKHDQYQQQQDRNTQRQMQHEQHYDLQQHNGDLQETELHPKMDETHVLELIRLRALLHASDIRSGTWIDEEKLYLSKILVFYHDGILILPPSTSLRVYVQEKLNCPCTRISKKVMRHHGKLGHTKNIKQAPSMKSNTETMNGLLELEALELNFLQAVALRESLRHRFIKRGKKEGNSSPYFKD